MAKKILTPARSEPVLYTLFGISCHLKDYRLSYLLNQALELDFIKMEDFQGFSFYHCRDDDRFNLYYLLANRGTEAFLFPELRQTDYLLLVEGPFKKAQKDHLLERIKAIPNVLTAFEVRFETIRNYETILSDLELHFMQIQKDTRQRYIPLKK